MKRLLLPLLAAIALPTAVNAFPWNSGIVVKNDPREKNLIYWQMAINTFSKELCTSTPKCQNQILRIEEKQ